MDVCVSCVATGASMLLMSPALPHITSVTERDAVTFRAQGPSLIPGVPQKSVLKLFRKKMKLMFIKVNILDTM